MELAYPSPALSDGEVGLRPWEDGDADCVRAASADRQIWRGTTVPKTSGQPEALAFIARQRSRLPTGEGISLAIVEHGTAVGLVHLGPRPQPSVLGLGYWLMPQARGRGLASRAVRLATVWAMQTLGARRVEAWVEPTNAASATLLERLGFEREGRLRSFLVLGGERTDVFVYSRIAVDWVERRDPAGD